MEDSVTGMARAALDGFEEEAGSPRAVNAALLVIGWALLAIAYPVQSVRPKFVPWSFGPEGERL